MSDLEKETTDIAELKKQVVALEAILFGVCGYVGLLQQERCPVCKTVYGAYIPKTCVGCGYVKPRVNDKAADMKLELLHRSIEVYAEKFVKGRV